MTYYAILHTPTGSLISQFKVLCSVAYMAQPFLADENKKYVAEQFLASLFDGYFTRKNLKIVKVKLTIQEG